MNHDRRIGMKTHLFADVVWTDGLVHVAGAQHQPEPIKRMSPLFDVLCREITEEYVRKKQNRLIGF